MQDPGLGVESAASLQGGFVFASVVLLAVLAQAIDGVKLVNGAEAPPAGQSPLAFNSQHKI